jgi:DNA-binding protein
MNSTVYVGNKSVMNYVLAVITQFNTENAEEVRIKARGKAISRAVDVEEMLKNRFLPEIKVKEVKLGTDVVENEEGKPINLSTIEIVLTK